MSRQYRPKVNKSTKKSRRIHLDKKYLPVIIIIGIIGILSLGTVLFLFAIGPPAQTPTTSNSLFFSTDYITEVDKSEDTNTTILVPANITETEEWTETDFYNISNYIILIDSNSTVDIDEDLSIYPSIIVKTEGLGYETNYNFFMTGFKNWEYTIYVYPISDTVNSILLDEDLNIIDFEEYVPGGGGNYTLEDDFLTESGNYTLMFNIPNYETECLAPILDPAEDTLMNRSITDPLTYYTHFDAFVFTFNDTVSVNTTMIVMEGFPAVVMIDGDKMFLTLYTPLGFSQQPASVVFELIIDTENELESIVYSRVLIPEGIDGTIATV